MKEEKRKGEITTAQKLAKEYLEKKGDQMSAAIKGILLFDGLSEEKAQLLAKEIVIAAASLARGNAW